MAEPGEVGLNGKTFRLRNGRISGGDGGGLFTYL